MEHIEWSTVIANLGGVATLLTLFWRFMKAQTSSLVTAQAPSKKEFTSLKDEVSELRNQSKQFAIMQIQVANVETKITEVKADLKDQTEQISQEITGAMAQVREQIRADKQDVRDRFNDIKSLIQAGQKP